MPHDLEYLFEEPADDGRATTQISHAVRNLDSCAEHLAFLAAAHRALYQHELAMKLTALAEAIRLNANRAYDAWSDEVNRSLEAARQGTANMLAVALHTTSEEARKLVP